MNRLTEEERIGLEDVFLSISTPLSRRNGSKNIGKIFYKLIKSMEPVKIAKSSLKHLKKAKKHILNPGIGLFMLKMVEKKKILS